jgi:hypothetical protein
MDAQTSAASMKKQAAIRLGKPYRKVGRPAKYLVVQRRYMRRKYFKRKYGCDVIAIMMRKGYLMTKKDAKTAARKEALKPQVEVQAAQPAVEEAPKVARDEFAGKDADMVVKGVVNAILEGKAVPGFSLLPEEKAKTNHTVEQIVIAKFAPGHPAYKMSLVTIKNEYAS